MYMYVATYIEISEMAQPKDFHDLNTNHLQILLCAWFHVTKGITYHFKQCSFKKSEFDVLKLPPDN